MGKAAAWLAVLGLALGAAGGAGAATLPPVLALPLSVDALPSVSTPPPASLQLSGSEGTGIWDPPPDPATLLLLATGLGGLIALSQREFV